VAGGRDPRRAGSLAWLDPRARRRRLQHDPLPRLRQRDPPRMGVATLARRVDGQPAGLHPPAPRRPLGCASMTDAPLTLVLLRHGESQWNALNLFTGWVDVDLSEKGEAEA